MKKIDQTLLDELTNRARSAPRLRSNHNFHPSLEDPVQRLCIAIEPGTYIRPQRHADPETFELIFVLRGSAVVLCFDDRGRVTERMHLSASGPVRGIELPAGTWHTLASRETGTVFIEVKQGPYRPATAEHTAPWAPAEGSGDVPAYEAWFQSARVGDLPPSGE